MTKDDAQQHGAAWATAAAKLADHTRNPYDSDANKLHAALCVLAGELAAAYFNMSKGLLPTGEPVPRQTDPTKSSGGADDWGG